MRKSNNNIAIICGQARKDYFTLESIKTAFRHFGIIILVFSLLLLMFSCAGNPPNPAGRNEETVSPARIFPDEDFGIIRDSVSEEANKLLDKGLDFAGRRDFDLATGLFNDAIKLDPDFASAYLQRAKALLAGTDGKKIFYNGKNYDWYISYRNYDNTYKRHNYGSTAPNKRIQKNREKYKKAVEDFTKAISIKPDIASAHRYRGIAYTLLEDYDKSVTEYNEALKVDPPSNYALDYAMRGYSCFFSAEDDWKSRTTDCFWGWPFPRKEAREAVNDYDKSIKLNPNYSFIYVYRGIALYYFEDQEKKFFLDPDMDKNLIIDLYNTIVDNFNKALKLDPKNADAYYERAACYWSWGIITPEFPGREDAALSDINNAVSCDEENISYRIGRWQKNWRKTNNRLYFDTIINLDPDAGCWYMLGAYELWMWKWRLKDYVNNEDVETLMADINTAIGLLNRAITLDKTLDHDTYLMLGHELYVTRGDLFFSKKKTWIIPSRILTRL